MEPKEQFGINLRRLRHQAGLSQLELSLRCGLDMAEISRLERGSRDPRLGTIARLADGLQVEVVELVRGVEPGERRIAR
jgi:transcriptional regulator with XRE-family HTH domain